jgi:hypothetical protein
MNNHWLEALKTRLESESDEARDVRFERLQQQGMINERGEVTGRLRRWDAALAITAVKRPPGSSQIQSFRCLVPVFGMPGGATIDVSRDSMVGYLKQGKKVITACHDERLGMWKEGCEVRLSARGSIRCDGVDDAEDNVGGLPEFQHSTSIL